MVAIVDYGVGNLFSLQSSFGAIGVPSVTTRDPDVLLKADRVILPGVGAFPDAAEKLHRSGMEEAVLEAARRGTPLMGICLGMQLLFDHSLEFGSHPGLGLIPGEIRPIDEVVPAGLKIPHIGWNALRLTGVDSPILRYVKEGDHVYFVHSYHAAQCRPWTLATTEYGGILTAAVAKDNVVGCQFHPEKSGTVGLNILRAFCEMEGH